MPKLYMIDFEKNPISVTEVNEIPFPLPQNKITTYMEVTEATSPTGEKEFLIKNPLFENSRTLIIKANSAEEAISKQLK